MFHTGIQICGWVINAMTGAPKSDEGVLDNVLGVRSAARPLAREEHESRSMPVEPGCPVVAAVHVARPQPAGDDQAAFSLMKTPQASGSV
jgi:hypothetical protein